MQYLLKILKGANAGAEIALAQGSVRFGSGESCDIVLADATLAEEAFVLESTEDDVSLRVLPDGEAKTLELYTVFKSGEMEFAVGEDGRVWPGLKREAPPSPQEKPEGEEPPPAGDDEPTAVSGDEPPPPPPLEEVAERADPCEPSPKPCEKRSAGCGCLLAVLVLLALFFVGGYWLALRYARSSFEGCGFRIDLNEPSIAVTGRKFDFRHFSLVADAAEDAGAAKVTAEPAPPPVTVESLATEAGLQFRRIEGRSLVSGNFAKRFDRLEFAARVYELESEAVLDLSDDETFRAGVDETLFTLSEGQIRARVATNRYVRLEGKVGTRQQLLDTVAALCADVNHLRIVDDTAVVCADGLATEAPTRFKPIMPPVPSPIRPAEPKPARLEVHARASVAAAAKTAAPTGGVSLAKGELPAKGAAGNGDRPAEMTLPDGLTRPAQNEPYVIRVATGEKVALKIPVAGVIVTPYPCLVMRNGARAVVGAVIEGWYVKGIDGEGVRFGRGREDFVWRP